jgi:hypothetical protein
VEIRKPAQCLVDAGRTRFVSPQDLTLFNGNQATFKPVPVKFAPENDGATRDADYANIQCYGDPGPEMDLKAGFPGPESLRLV